MRVNQSGSNPISGNEVPPKGGPRTQGNKEAAARGATHGAAEAKSGKPLEKAEGIARKSSTERNTPASKVSSAHGEKAEISQKAKDFAQVKAAAGQAPDVREEKIAELKRRIAEGKYKVNADAVADRMVDEHLSSPIR